MTLGTGRIEIGQGSPPSVRLIAAPRPRKGHGEEDTFVDDDDLVGPTPSPDEEEAERRRRDDAEPAGNPAG